MSKKATAPANDRRTMLPMLPSTVELELQVARYATMSQEEIHHELMRSGIDPEPVIASVEAFLSERLGSRRRRRA